MKEFLTEDPVITVNEVGMVSIFLNFIHCTCICFLNCVLLSGMRILIPVVIIYEAVLYKSLNVLEIPILDRLLLFIIKLYLV